ncbi:Hypothetical predicted protein [Paramuricea clavata]|uniref:DUF7587 domain-containing protein n=1 Tax=Paramuricea clavata TaxID=317549 RepID=A0A7D9HT44_PARCT|nr:Hypothetical predicted protein [Paramuricea clavata]
MAQSLEEGLYHLNLMSSTSDYCGMWGLDELYRVCRDDENINPDIVCKANPNDQDSWNRTVEQHINNGSQNSSRFISTTISRDVALKWAYYTMENPSNIEERLTPRRIIKIFISRIPQDTASQMINLTVEEVRNYFLGGATQICRAKSSQEVLFQKYIPFYTWYQGSSQQVFELWQHPPKPPKPKSKNPKNNVYNVLSGKGKSEAKMAAIDVQ